MPKQKTRRSAAKRFEVSGSGKVRRRQAGRAHLKVGKKSSRRLRRLDGDVPVSAADRKRVDRMLGR
ncbi:MAG: 50S ribosomal protein L35 [Actinobacteria bacterium RBG_16_67_10]|jgi:large subunit ribosomal protein L35|nr:MAG: 50S ribosomal protein L35 [Actinobacteria bacterium RBG_16_67_10]